MTTEGEAQPQASPIPLPELPVVAEMYMGIANRLLDVSRQKQEGNAIGWGSLITPKEIIYAMDVPMIYQEVLGAWVSILQLSPKYCQIAETFGFSRDVCALHRCYIGCAAAEIRDPFFENAFCVPDFVIGTNYGCMSNAKSNRFIVEHFNVPYFFADAPINTWGRDIPDYAVDYYADQLRKMIEFIERFGYKMDWDKLSEQVQFTKDLNVLLEEIDLYRRATPTPIKAFDSFIAATAPLTLPQHMRTLSLFERLRDALKERVAKGIGIVDDEKLRLLWIGIPPVCNMELLNYCEKYGAVVSKNMLEYMVGFPLDPELLDPDKPLESIARGMIASPVNPLYALGIEQVVQMAKDYQVDGAISVVKRSCGLLPGMQQLVKDALAKESGVPSIVFDLDGVDAREYDEAAVKSNIDAFIESLLAAKKAG